jgi:hypothetical protein
VCATGGDDDAGAGWGVEGAQGGDGHDAQVKAVASKSTGPLPTVQTCVPFRLIDSILQKTAYMSWFAWSGFCPKFFETL